jgi:hypothetical protein
MLVRGMVGVLRSCRGNAYIEYVVVAGAISLAALWLWGGGRYQGAAASYQAQLDIVMGNIAGGP